MLKAKLFLIQVQFPPLEKNVDQSKHDEIGKEIARVIDASSFKPHRWLREPLRLTFLGWAELTAAGACIQALLAERCFIRQLEKLWLPRCQCWRTGCSTLFPLPMMGFENGNFHRGTLGLPGLVQFLGLL